MLMLWSAPRSRSTAFSRMMIERGDFTAVHEPFSYLAVFGYADISGRQLATAPEVIAELRSPATTRQVFIKETTDKLVLGAASAVGADQMFWSARNDERPSCIVPRFAALIRWLI